MESIWENNNKKEYKKLEDDIYTKVCIIGGGITGINTAYQLYKNGIDFVILEKSKLCSSATLRTTAKITIQHGLIYNYLINSFGLDYAKKYYLSQEYAIKYLEDVINLERINCDFVRENSYVFTNDDSKKIDIKAEYEAINKISKEKAEYIENSSLPILCKYAVCLKNQASFNPIKYLNGLLDKMSVDNIFEDTTVECIKSSNGKNIVFANNKKVICDYVVIATKYPIKDIPGFYFFKLYQETSYVIAIKPNDIKKFEGMYISTDFPKISFRWAKFDNEDILLIGGNSNKTGQETALKDKYEFLENIAKQIYPNCNIICRWNTQDTISLDKLPYIGKFSRFKKNIFVATGYNKWGMTNSVIAAKIIVDKICGNNNKYEDIFNSLRFSPIKNFKELINMAKTSINALFFNKLKIKRKNNVKIKNGTIYNENGNLVGIYEDKDKKIYKVNPVCKHLGCLLKFNELDNTWDCPCHGSRYDYKGNLIYGPSSKNLDRYN